MFCVWFSGCECDSGVVGNARPCQGRDRGFEPRLSLSCKTSEIRCFFSKQAVSGVFSFRKTERGNRKKVHGNGDFVAQKNERLLYKRGVIQKRKDDQIEFQEIQEEVRPSKGLKRLDIYFI